MTTERYQELEREFKVIRDERGVHQNTAVRIGTAFLDLLRYCMSGEFDEIIFNKVLNKPKFLQGLITLGTIVLGEYAEGLQGGIITEEGVAELKDLWVREHAKLGDGQIHRDEAGRVIPALEVKGDSTFSGNLSSPEFVSAFLGGIGWAIQKKEFVNAAGEIEYKYTLEIDNAVIRNTLRVFEMIISQLLGENDNRVFSAMMEVHHYDPETGRVWLSTMGGKFYQCFRKDDCIMVQHYQPGNTVVEGGDGYVTKSYELLITEVGSGGQEDENGDRLDWVTFKNFATQMADDNGNPYTPEQLIAQGDTFVRVDNLTDPERKGIVTMMTVGNNTPYMDVIYGLKTDPKHATKVRIGNLEGIQSEVFGWLESFGAYLQNFYGIGKFVNAQTGENLTARTEMLAESFKTLYTETTYNVSDEDNFLTNGFFQKELEGWSLVYADGSAYVAPTVGDFVTVIEQAGGQADPMLLNGEMIATRKENVADIQEVDGIKVLHIRNMGVSQDFSLIKEKGQHEEMESDDPESTQTVSVDDPMFMGMRFLPLTKGTLRVRFLKSGGTSTGWETELDEGYDWFLLQARDAEGDRWDFAGEGRMIITYTGECYIRFVTLTTDAVANSRYTFSTKIEETARRITIEAARQDSNLNTAVASIQLEYNQIVNTVANNKSAADRAFENLTADLAAETLARQTDDNLFKATWFYQNDTLLALMAGEFNADGTIKGYSDLKVEVANIKTTVTDNKTAADNAFANLTADLAAEALARQTDDNLFKATWFYQNDTLLSLMAGEFNADGTIKGYSDLKVEVGNIKTTVAANKTAADNAFAELNNTTIPGLVSDIQAANGLAGAANTLAGTANTLAGSAKDRADSAYTLADNAYDYGYYSASWISQRETRLLAAVALFDANGNIKETSGLVTESNFATLFSAAVEDDGTIMKKADMGTYVKKNGNGYITGAYIDADRIDFTTNGFSISNDSGDTTLYLDQNGNLSVMGSINSGSRIGGFSVSGTAIYWPEDAYGYFTDLEHGSLTLRNKASIALNIYGKVNIAGYLSSGSSRSFFSFEGFNSDGDALVKVLNLPISKPSESGYLYTSSGTLKIS